MCPKVRFGVVQGAKGLPRGLGGGTPDEKNLKQMLKFTWEGARLSKTNAVVGCLRASLQTAILAMFFGRGLRLLQLPCQTSLGLYCASKAQIGMLSFILSRWPRGCLRNRGHMLMVAGTVESTNVSTCFAGLGPSNS